jgi:two-component system, NtrC family, sensor histidine kinase GlrK
MSNQPQHYNYFMRLWRPRSLADLMFIGFALVAVPLLFAVVVSVTKVRGLADESAALVRSGVESTDYTQQLFQHITTMERNARLFQLLRDESFLTVYETARQRFHDTLDKVAVAVGETSPLNTQIQTLRRADADLEMQLQAMRSTAANPSSTELNDAFVVLSDAASSLSEKTGQQIDSGLSHIQSSTGETQRYLFWQSAGVIILTATLVAVFAYLLMRPIRQIDIAIHQLGQGTFSKNISVSGPSDMRKLGEQLEWLRVRLLELAQERNRFLRHMSHELKTPLTGVREGTELLLDGAVGELTPGQREVGEILRDNSIRLQQLIENLLSFSAWQTRHSGLDLSQFRLRPLVKSALETHQLTLLAQRMHLDLKVDDLELLADRPKLKLILDNLISNALKYSPKGGTIYVHAAANESRQQLILDVADTGPGIAPAERTAVFEAFYSGRAPTSGHLKGTGIGLSVVSEFVQAHGGKIEIMEGMFPGAHFRIHMPIKAREVAAA